MVLVLAVMSSEVAAASTPNVSGIWLVYVPASNTSASQIFVMRDVANRITGTWGEFTLSGTVFAFDGDSDLVRWVRAAFGVGDNELAGEVHVQVDQHCSVKPPDP